MVENGAVINALAWKIFKVNLKRSRMQMKRMIHFIRIYIGDLPIFNRTQRYLNIGSMQYLCA